MKLVYSERLEHKTDPGNCVGFFLRVEAWQESPEDNASGALPSLIILSWGTFHWESEEVDRRVVLESCHDAHLIRRAIKEVDEQWALMLVEDKVGAR